MKCALVISPLLVTLSAASCYTPTPRECTPAKPCPPGKLCSERFECLDACARTEDCADRAHACWQGTCRLYEATCTEDAECADGWFCDGADCQRKLALGRDCADARQCESANCVDGVCCQSACDTTCSACSMALTGVQSGACAPISVGTDPEDECIPLQGCDGAGACHPGLGLGQPCSDDGYCTSGHCVDGVCCDSLCDSGCDACFSALTGGESGVCGQVIPGLDPRGACAFDQGCDGGGACHPGSPAGALCASDTTCTSFVCVDSVCCSTSCDGACEGCSVLLTGSASGTCNAIANGADPENECDGSLTCSGRRACKATSGAPCSVAADCASGYCAIDTCADPPAILPPEPYFPWNGYYSGSLHHEPNLRPTFRWGQGFGGVGALTYELQIDDTCTTAEFRECTLPSPEFADGTANLEIRTGAPLPVSLNQPVGRRYYWRVRACDTLATCSPWSAIRYIEVGRQPKDLNGDGFADVAAGMSSLLHAGEGGVIVRYGGSAGLGDTSTSLLENEAGKVVRMVGDTNGDGYGDLLVGIPRADGSGGVLSVGEAVLYYGAASGPQANTRIPSPVSIQNYGFGNAVAGAGDVDADGYGDFVICAASAVDLEWGDGKVYLFRGGLGIVSTSAAQSISNPRSADTTAFCEQADGNGDLDGDGHSDIAIVSRSPDLAANGPGFVHVFLGATSGLRLPSTTLSNPVTSNGGRFGDIVRFAQSTTGSRVGALAVATPLFFDLFPPEASTRVGAIQVCEAVATAGTTACSAVNNPVTFGVGGGYSAYFPMLLSAGDANGDGLPDLLMTNSFLGTAPLGQAYVVLAPSSGPWAIPTTLPPPTLSGESSNFALSGAFVGDLNGDGFDDLVLRSATISALDASTKTLTYRLHTWHGSISGATSGSYSTTLYTRSVSAALAANTAVALDELD